MDIRMPRVDGLEATRRLAGSTSRVLILTTFDVDEYVYETLRAGASGFLLKDTPRGPADQRHPDRRAGGCPARPVDHAAADRAVRPPAAAVRSTRRPRRADRTRARGHATARARAVQRRDRPGADRGRRHGQDPRGPDPAEAGPARPGPGGRQRLRVRPRAARGRLTLRQPGWMFMLLWNTFSGSYLAFTPSKR